MIDGFFNLINNWNVSKNERQKLQHTYLLLAVVVLVLAGLVSLVDDTLGRNMLKLAALGLVAFACNAIAWNLHNSAIIQKLSTKPKRR